MSTFCCYQALVWQVESGSEAKKDADRVNQLNAELEKKSKALEDIEKQLEETKVHEAEVKIFNRQQNQRNRANFGSRRRRNWPQ